MARTTLEGGEKLKARLAELSARLARPGTLSVGYLSSATYPDGTPVAYIAAIQEWGARIEREPSEVTLYRQVNKARDGFAKGGRFVKAAKANFASDHYVGAYVINIPARPSFRNMIATGSPGWGDRLGKIMKAKDYEVEPSLKIMGMSLAEDLQQSITQFSDPPNAPSTIAKKGFSKPLIDTGVMQRAVDFEVNE